MRSVDLHVHTTCSDGTDSPAQVVRKAGELGLAAIAITDHDTTVGVMEAQAAGTEAGLRVVPGIEISTEYEGREVHLLGYLLDPDSPSLKPVLEWTVNDRNFRNEKMVALLQRDGYHISMEQLKAEHPNTIIGRPHMAEALLQAGEVESIQDAFDRLLGNGKPYCLPRTYMPFYRAAEVIFSAGGVPVLAHPLQYGYDDEQRRKLMNLGDRYGLIYTGGSDYHGSRKPHIHLGTGMGHLQVPENVLGKLDEVQRRVHPEQFIGT